MAKEEDVSDKESVDKEVPEVERKAREAGHRSKEEWVAEGKDPDAWVDAGEFMRRAPLYEGIHKANRTIKNLEKKLNLLVQHQSEMVDAKVKQRLESLKVQKKQAAADRDVEKLVELDEEIEKVKEEAKTTKAEVKEDFTDALEEWKEANPWYENDEDMAAYANGIGSRFEKEHGPNSDDPWTMDKILKETAKRTKKAFEWKTKNPNREQASKVAGTRSGSADTPATSRNKLPTYNDLPPEAQTMYKEFVKTDKNPHGIMTKDEYLHQYAVKAGLIQESE